MRKLTCIVVDDEPLAVKMLENFVSRTPDLQLLASFNDPIEALGAIKEKKPDVAFLDIQMPELNGIELARIIPRSTKIIFTTAFEQYALEGYKANAFDYLLKPISYETFLKTIDKAESDSVIRKKRSIVNEDKFIFVKSDYKLVQICLNDILYIEGLKDYVKIYLEGNKRGVMSLINMKKIDESLPHPEFMRVHRSYIVHMPKVKLIDRGRIVFGEEYIPISESYKDVVQRYLDAHTIM